MIDFITALVCYPPALWHTMRNSTTDRARRGAQFMDNRHPGWHREINLDSLDLSSLNFCVLGQRHGSFEIGRDKEQLSLLSALRLGFVTPHSREYRAITTAWAWEIEARLFHDYSNEYTTNTNERVAA